MTSHFYEPQVLHLPTQQHVDPYPAPSLTMVFPSLRPTPLNDSKSSGPRYSLSRPLSPTVLTRPLLRPPSSPKNAPTSIPDQQELTDLNNSLLVLATVFPDVRPEVFREMLTTFSEESRLFIVAEQLLKHKVTWVKDRWRIPSKSGSSSNILREVFEVEKESDGKKSGSVTLLPLEEQFRSESYKQATRSMLCQEFKGLSRSTIDGVLAEQNYSYSYCRPILLGLASKSWRFSFSAFLSKWKRASQTGADNHFMVVYDATQTGKPSDIPTVRPTGDKELDAEIYSTVLKPILEHKAQKSVTQDFDFATALNEEEAEQASALFECECCFSTSTFEQIATCTNHAHTICFACIQHTVSEALYGQSWGLNIDHTRGQIACPALSTNSTSHCAGVIPHTLARQAITSTKPGHQTWQKLQSRLADEALLKSQAPLIRCPFCPYAEIDDLYLPPRTLNYRFNTRTPFLTILLVLLPWNFIPLLLFYILLITFLPTLNPYQVSFLPNLPRLPNPLTLLSTSLKTLSRRTHLSPRFTCRSPTCARTSCLLCHQSWQDSHICHESATISLRTTVEAARTAALKRTCPRCGLGFVKESGCNKMVCVCGYIMCYVCRQGLGKGSGGGGGGIGGPGQGQARAGAGEGEGEGYRHFCQHFRPAAGRCTECDKCDLYRGENEDEVVKRAGERAEREWRIREGWEGKKEGSTRMMPTSMMEGGGRSLRWEMQDLVDWWVEKVLKC